MSLTTPLRRSVRLPSSLPSARLTTHPRTLLQSTCRRHASATASTSSSTSPTPARLSRRQQAEQAYYRKRMIVSACGFAGSVLAIISLIGLYDVKPIHKTDSEDGSNNNNSSSNSDIKLDTPTPFLSNPDAKEAPELIETGTSHIPHFPKSIFLPSTTGSTSSETEYHLLGLGIRTVSFLNIQVYIVGLYLPTSALSTLQSRLIKTQNATATTLVPGERDALRTALLDPVASEELWDKILSGDAGDMPMALRIVPVRNTDFAHLRDGFVRGLTGRTARAAQAGNKEYESESFGLAVKEFKAMFSQSTKKNLPKGQPLILVRGEDKSFTALYQDLDKEGKVLQNVELGKVGDERIGKLMWLHYLAGKSPASEPARKSVAEGIMELVERPVGTVEAQVV